MPKSRQAYLLLGAARIRAEVASRSPTDNLNQFDLKHANRMENDALVPVREPEIGRGNELVPEQNDYKRHSVNLKDTLSHPSYVNARASQERLELAEHADALEAALDVAETINASNSLEKMLSHQLAMLHRTAMKIGAQLTQQVNRMEGMIDQNAFQRYNTEMARTAGALSRLTGGFQEGLKTLHTLRHGGTQNINVNHSNVQNVAVSGDAIVAGAIGGPTDKIRNSENGR
jgi:hypothetical protein